MCVASFKKVLLNGPVRQSSFKNFELLERVSAVLLGLDQGWPHFLCSGQKNGLKKLGRHKNVSKKLGGHNLTM